MVERIARGLLSSPLFNYISIAQYGGPRVALVHQITFYDNRRDDSATVENQTAYRKTRRERTRVWALHIESHLTTETGAHVDRTLIDARRAFN